VRSKAISYIAFGFAL